jgi:hypothetical protein
MPDVDRRPPEERLAEADRHIADAEGRIARQRDVIADLERDSHPVKEARALLQTMIESLEQMQTHRRIIQAEIDGRL